VKDRLDGGRHSPVEGGAVTAAAAATAEHVSSSGGERWVDRPSDEFDHPADDQAPAFGSGLGGKPAQPQQQHLGQFNWREDIEACRAQLKAVNALCGVWCGDGALRAV
jgi:hypothetical protein